MTIWGHSKSASAQAGFSLIEVFVTLAGLAVVAGIWATMVNQQSLFQHSIATQSGFSNLTSIAQQITSSPSTCAATGLTGTPISIPNPNAPPITPVKFLMPGLLLQPGAVILNGGAQVTAVDLSFDAPMVPTAGITFPAHLTITATQDYVTASGKPNLYGGPPVVTKTIDFFVDYDAGLGQITACGGAAGPTGPTCVFDMSGPPPSPTGVFWKPVVTNPNFVAYREPASLGINCDGSVLQAVTQAGFLSDFQTMLTPKKWLFETTVTPNGSLMVVGKLPSGGQHNGEFKGTVTVRPDGATYYAPPTPSQLSNNYSFLGHLGGTAPYSFKVDYSAATGTYVVKLWALKSYHTWPHWKLYTVNVGKGFKL